MDSRVDAAFAWLAAHEDALIDETRTLLQIPSLLDSAVPGGPFGAENLRALEWMLGRAESRGWRTKNLDGYCGYAETGSGEGEVLTLGHLDVVPVGPGWSFPPFGAEVHEGYIYARGATDDKGPTMAAFFAACAIKETYGELPVRLRAFFGSDEESGFRCVHHYLKTEKAPTFGVAPDAGWPLIHGEKGISDLTLRTEGGVLANAHVRLVELTGGQRTNIVIDSARARVKVSHAALGHVQKKIADGWDRNVTVTWTAADDGDWAGEYVIEAVGKAAHGSTPWAGDNAAVRILRLLQEVSPIPDSDQFDEVLWMAHPAGAGLGIAGADEPSGPLSANLGVVKTVRGALELTVNVRYPVTWTGEILRGKVERYLAERRGGFWLVEMSDSPPLYFPLEHPLVAAVVDSYEAEMGERLTPKTMGGGTYARAVPNCAAIGTGWPGDGDAHQTDEKVAVASLVKMSRIYVRILLRLIDEAARA